ncbi:collagen alpha-1(I) chain-like [Saccopteryx bilineata]|uniref:collagen alpha-1(I) chain-like n=1 Tax=Saccopteryx bilineata TaxID=59482 RepID=UPI00338F40E4
MTPATRTHLNLAPDAHSDLVTPSPNAHTQPRGGEPAPGAHPGQHGLPLSPGRPEAVTRRRVPSLSPRRDLSELGAPRTPRQLLDPKLTHAAPPGEGSGLRRGAAPREPWERRARGRASGCRRGSLGRSGGQRAPRPQARSAWATRHPPAALAPAPDSCTDMKRGPRTPKKPAPANQRRAPPSLRPPLAAPSTPAGGALGLTRRWTPPPADPLPEPTLQPLQPLPTKDPHLAGCPPAHLAQRLAHPPNFWDRLLVTNLEPGPPPQERAPRTLWVPECPPPPDSSPSTLSCPPTAPEPGRSKSSYLPRPSPSPTRAGGPEIQFCGPSGPVEQNCWLSPTGQTEDTEARREPAAEEEGREQRNLGGLRSRGDGESSTSSRPSALAGSAAPGVDAQMEPRRAPGSAGGSRAGPGPPPASASRRGAGRGAGPALPRRSAFRSAPLRSGARGARASGNFALRERRRRAPGRGRRGRAPESQAADTGPRGRLGQIAAKPRDRSVSLGPGGSVSETARPHGPPPVSRKAASWSSSPGTRRARPPRGHRRRKGTGAPSGRRAAPGSRGGGLPRRSDTQPAALWAASRTPQGVGARPAGPLPGLLPAGLARNPAAAGTELLRRAEEPSGAAKRCLSRQAAGWAEAVTLIRAPALDAGLLRSPAGTNPPGREERGARQQTAQLTVEGDCSRMGRGAQRPQEHRGEAGLSLAKPAHGTGGQVQTRLRGQDRAHPLPRAESGGGGDKGPSSGAGGRSGRLWESPGLEACGSA